MSAGYSEREISRLILEKNLYGLDIDDRAGQLAYFALIMKARSYSRRFFKDIEKNSIELNVCAIQESNGLNEEDIEYFADGNKVLKRDIEYLFHIFIANTNEYGNIADIIVPIPMSLSYFLAYASITGKYVNIGDIGLVIESPILYAI